MTTIPRLSATLGLASTLVSLRNDMVDLQRQLGTGRRAETYGGLGGARDVALAMRGKLSAFDAYSASREQVGLRVNLATQSLSRIAEIAASAKGNATPTGLDTSQGGQTPAQRTAREQIEETLSLLNEDVAGRFLFGGRATDRQPVENANTILDGDGARAGFKQVVAERRIADLGLAGTGRVTTGGTGAEVTLAEDGDHPFGFKLAGISPPPGFDGSVVQPGGTAPQTLSVTFGATQPAAGTAIRVSLDMPDGGRSEIVLTATNANPPGDGGFAIGADADATAANFRAALGTAIEVASASKLSVASAFAAADNFFDVSDTRLPDRVVFDAGGEATGLVAGTAEDTVAWYRGDGDASVAARDTATARVDDRVTVSYGARATEKPLRDVVATLAVFATAEFSPGTPEEAARYETMALGVRERLDGGDKPDSVAAMSASLATADGAMSRAEERQRAEKGLLGDMLGEIEGVVDEEVAIKLLNLQTRLQASYEATALLSRLSLVNYL